LPRYRGASPIAAAILAGDAETGVSLMKMDAGLDTGPVYASVTTPIYDNDTTDVLTARLSMLGAQMVIDQLPRIANGELEAVRQSDDGASMTRPIVKSDGVVDWSVPAIHIERQVRAMWPWPRAWTMADGQQLQIHVSAVTDCDTGAVPGRFLLVGGHLMVQSGKDCVLLHKVQPAGGKPMTGAAWLAGFRGTSAQFAEVDDAAGERLLIELIS
ncbi:MAG: methionyl-tRNA formyltransferase, partial [Thermomicrobiales bacterium]